MALVLLHGCASGESDAGADDGTPANLGGGPSEESFNGGSTTHTLEAEPAPPIFAYQAYDHDVEVTMAEAGCYEASTTPASCADCATKLTVERADGCAAPSGNLHVEVDAPSGLIVTNPVRNTGASDQTICNAELAFQRRFGLSQDAFAYYRSRNLAPWYREHATDRASSTDFAACSEAAPRLRAAFYPL